MRKKIKLTGCPICGGDFALIAGLRTCTKCGHRAPVEFKFGRNLTERERPKDYIIGGGAKIMPTQQDDE